MNDNENADNNDNDNNNDHDDDDNNDDCNKGGDDIVDVTWTAAADADDFRWWQ